ncbi:MAG: Gfo/Idh/MocA family oxidoreductase [Acidiferrobacterales bacterium]
MSSHEQAAKHPLGHTHKVRVGVVGVGYLGRFHARIYSEMSGVKLVGVADVDQRVAQSVADAHGCAAFTDAEALVDKVDAVSIVVPTVVHLPVARPFLERGVHTLMEKPIAPTFEEALEIVKLAERDGVILQVGHLERFNAGVMALAERVQDARFIEVHRLGPFVDRATDVDVVTDLMIHDIDIATSLVKAHIRDVAAVGIPVLTEHVDIANARLEFENGAVANVTASRVSNKKFRRIRVFGHNSYYGLNYIDQQLEVVQARQGGKGGQRAEIVSERLEIEPRPPLDVELEHFIKSVREGRPPLVDGRVGLEAVRVAELVKEKIDASRH